MRTASDGAFSYDSGASLIELGALQPTPQPASPEALIEVRAPYYALVGARVLGPGCVEAFVSPEQSLDMEVGALPAAEAGRHMAILGSMACATLRPSDKTRCYFLAERATLSSPEQAPSLRSTEPLRVTATALPSRERDGEAECEIRSMDGRLLFALRVGYKVVPEKVFRRLFAAFRVDMRKSPRAGAETSEPGRDFPRHNPYLRRLDLSVISLSNQEIRGELLNIPAEACAGHFPLYPALPVAILMEVFSNAGGALLQARLGNSGLRYRVRNAGILASKLVFAGQSISVRGEVVSDLESGGAKVRMSAWLPGGEEVSSATFDIEPAR
jgi:hypothetical protein